MKTFFKIVVSFLGVIVLILGGIHMYVQHQKQELINIVKSPEVKRIIEEDLKKENKTALTNLGVIQRYELDEQSVEHNPMGGINFTIWINNDRNASVGYHVDKHFATGELSLMGMSYSLRFQELVKKGQKNE